MLETIIFIVCWIVNSAIVVGGMLYSYNLGEKHGIKTAVIEILKDEEIVTEISSNEECKKG